MTTLASFLKGVNPFSHIQHAPEAANPSLVLHVNRQEDFEPTGKTFSLLNYPDNPSEVLRASWVNSGYKESTLKTVWIREEVELL